MGRVSSRRSRSAQRSFPMTRMWWPRTHIPICIGSALRSRSLRACP
jgi:hypothetical protein